MKELEAIKERMGAAAAGPWIGVGGANFIRVSGPPIGRITRAANQTFAAHAGVDIPKLVAALEAVDQALAGLDAIFDGPGDDDEAIRTISRGLRETIAEALQ